MNLQAEVNPCYNAKLSDICISTSAAPTYLPSYYFKNNDDSGNDQEYNLIDGGVAANNPVYYRYIYIKHKIIVRIKNKTKSFNGSGWV
ncbi:putative patatin-like phospholipase domain, Acyl transferase/acyl hydrolase/lysophospholipase [Helianthus anomalus]